VAVASAGDVNGDGFDDIVIGTPMCGPGNAPPGKAFVFPGAADGLQRKAAWRKRGRKFGAHNGSNFGNAVASAGDVNGDGYDDVLVGAPRYGHGQPDEGRALVYHGSSSGLNSEPDWTFESDARETFLGSSIAAAGDVNGDGFDDVLVGADKYDGQVKDEGAAFVFLGSASGLEPTPSWTAFGGRPTAWFGISVASAGDVNGDGFDDVLVGASRYSNGQHDEGGAFLFLGSPAGLSATPSWTEEGNEIYAYFGYSVAPAGDIDHDGFDDILVGAKGADAMGKPDVGKAFLYCGSASGLSKQPRWMAVGPHEGCLFGHPVASAGDVNADGFDDLIIGAERFTHGELMEGAAFVFYMGPGPSQAPTGAALKEDAPEPPTP
jgi:hypothetical protein